MELETNVRDWKIIARIVEELERARKEHPTFSPGGVNGAYVILGEEVGEIAKAIQEEGPEQQLDEIAQVAAVCIRMMGLIMKHK